MRQPHGGSEQSLEQGPEAVTDQRSLALAMRAQPVLHLLPKLFANDALVLAVVDLALVLDAADIDHVGQQQVQAGLGEGIAAAHVALARPPALVDPAAALQFLDHRA